MPRQATIFRRNPPILTALPASPADGQEILLAPSAYATQGIVWHCRYNLANAYWAVLSGPPIYAGESTLTSQTTNSTAYSYGTNNLTPTIALPFKGGWDLEWTVWGTISVDANDFRVAPHVNGVVVADFGSSIHASWFQTWAGRVRYIAGAAGLQFDMRFSVNQNAAVVFNTYTRVIYARPVYLVA